MIDALVWAAQAAGVFLVATLIASLLSSLLYPSFRRAINGFRPDTRSLSTWWFALIGPAVGLVTVLLYLAPAHAQPFILQHCHDGVCGSHAPVIAADSLGGIGLLAFTAVLAFLFTAAVARVVVSGRRRLALLFALSTPRQRHLITDSDRLFAMCCGLLRQRIVVSSALIERLSAAELDVVLAHERAHEARFDNLRNLSARWATCLWPAGRGSRLRAELAEDAERACDALALQAVDDPSLFRQAVAVMASEPALVQPRAPVRFGSDAGEARLRAASAGDGRHPGPAYLLVALIWTLQLTVVAAMSHPIVEGLSALSW